MSQDKVHVMIDIETLDVIPSAVILSIGATVITDRFDEENFFYKECDPETQFERSISQSTKEWWIKQNIPIPGVDCKISLNIVLMDLSLWISTLRAEPIIWCKGTDFDTAILSNAYAQYKFPLPWKYNAVRDFRTVKKLFPHYSYPVNPNAHHALSDAKHQAEELKGILKANPNLTLA